MTKASDWLARPGKAVAAGLMLFLWLWSFTLAVSPELHAQLHPDSNAPKHHCVVNHIQQNHLLAGTAAVSVTALLMVVGFVYWAFVSFLPTRDYRLSPSRAPPVLLSSHLVVG